MNAFLESHRDRLSLEFRLLKYAPRPWTVTDSLLVGALLVEYLNHYPYQRALERKNSGKLEPELTADLYVNVLAGPSANRSAADTWGTRGQQRR